MGSAGGVAGAILVETALPTAGGAAGDAAALDVAGAVAAGTPGMAVAGADVLAGTEDAIVVGWDVAVLAGGGAGGSLRQDGSRHPADTAVKRHTFTRRGAITRAL